MMRQILKDKESSTIEKLRSLLRTFEKLLGGGMCSFALSGKNQTPCVFNVLDLSYISLWWIIDSRVTKHMTQSSYQFIFYNPCLSNRKIATIDGTLTTVTGLGGMISLSTDHSHLKIFSMSQDCLPILSLLINLHNIWGRWLGVLGWRMNLTTLKNLKSKVVLRISYLYHCFLSLVPLIKKKKYGVGIFVLVILHSILLESCSQFYSKEFVLKISNLRCVNLPSINVMFSNKQ